MHTTKLILKKGKKESLMSLENRKGHFTVWETKLQRTVADLGEGPGEAPPLDLLAQGLDPPLIKALTQV